MSNEQNTNPAEPEKDTGVAEFGANTPDTPAQAGAATEPNNPVKKDDFLSKPPVKPDTSVEEAREKERETRKEGIIKDVFNKYVETDENGNTSFEKVPNDMRWAVEEIKNRYFNQAEAPTPPASIDIDLLLEKKIAQKTFEAEVERIVQDNSYSDIQKADIKDEFNKLTKSGVPQSEALRIAETLVNATTKKIVGTMPKPGKAPDLTKTVFTAEEYSNLPQKEFEIIYNKLQKGEVRITG